ncbi:hypothetical protein DXG03_001776 [Asterophora parasitica]|uniref:Uncharacterized protein n=1 Tax=Asterophora parasitica TaxID=117018 RepID=A0A9P7G344_9AGAR|nr:hypothetical protein DXG03_001776 [Asterophora parasitica]
MLLVTSSSKVSPLRKYSNIPGKEIEQLFNGDASISHIVWRDSIVHDSAITIHPLIETSAQDLITKCLQRNPIARLSLLAVKKHSYFSTT